MKPQKFYKVKMEVVLIGVMQHSRSAQTIQKYLMDGLTEMFDYQKYKTPTLKITIKSATQDEYNVFTRAE